MRTSFSHLRHLPVVTERGISLGRISDVEIDTDSHAASCYIVVSGFGPFSRVHRVSPAQVVSITLEQMVVRDAMVPEPEARLARAPAPAGSSL